MMESGLFEFANRPYTLVSFVDSEPHGSHLLGVVKGPIGAFLPKRWEGLGEKSKVYSDSKSDQPDSVHNDVVHPQLHR